MKTKRTILALILAIIMVITIAACAGAPDDEPEPTRTPRPTEEPDPTPTPTPESPDADADADGDADADADADTDTTPTPRPSGGGNIDDVLSGLDFLEKENAAPFGEWVWYITSNHNTGEHEKLYIRIIGIERDPVAVEKAMELYTGNWSFDFTDDQKRDVELGIMEYEIHVPAEWETSDWGMMPPSPNWSAKSIEGTSFKSKGGTTWIGVGSSYAYRTDETTENLHTGDTIVQKQIFTILKDYDESEYVFELSWYEGAIETDNARKTYFALS